MGPSATNLECIISRVTKPKAHFSKHEVPDLQPKAIVPSPQIIFAPHRCRSPLCPRCRRSVAAKLRHKWGPIVNTFRRLKLVTLTVDHSLFFSPAEAFLYMKHERCVARLLRELRRLGKK